MTFQDKEATQQQPASAEVYNFWNNSLYYRYTSHDTDLTIDGNVYTHVAIKRGTISFDPKGLGTKTSIEAPVTGPFLSYVSNQPFVPLQVAIKKYYLDDLATSLLLFSGFVKTAKVADHVAVAECLPSEYELERKIPRILFQPNCNFELFDARCGLTEATYLVNANVTVSGNTLVSDDFGAFANGYFDSGYVVFGNDIRMITQHVHNTLYLHVAFGVELTSGSLVTVYPGCLKDPATCKNKFNNLSNFLGMPYIPDKNPTIYYLR